jgi:calmodulin
VQSWHEEELTAGEIALYRHHFSLIDTSDNKEIEASELSALFASLGGNISEADCKEIIKDIDGDGTGTINFSEFISLVCRVSPHVDTIRLPFLSYTML